MIVGVDGRELQGRATGTGRYLRSLLRAWPAGDRFLLYTRGPLELDLPAVEVRPLPPLSPGLLWQELRMAPAAERDGVDVFFSPAYVCPLGLRRPRVTAVHDLSFFSYRQDFTWSDAFRRRRLVSASVARSSAILGCSEFTCRELRSVFPDAAPRVRHVPLGPDEDLPPAPPRREPGPRLLTVGSILNRRRVPSLLHTMAALQHRVKGLTLDVIGDNRTHPRLDLAAMSEELGLQDAVRWRGFVTDAELAQAYADADAAVFLSDYEGFGLPALEAMARGVPVVISDKPSLSEIFGGAALVTRPEIEFLFDALQRVLTDDVLRADLVARGRALAATFSWRRTAELTRAALAEAAA